MKPAKNKKKTNKLTCKDKLDIVAKEVENLTKEAKDFFHLVETNERKKDGTN
jgi:hypothetical protein